MLLCEMGDLVAADTNKAEILNVFRVLFFQEVSQTSVTSCGIQ